MYILAVNPFFDSYLNADFFGKLIFLTLFAMSIVSWIILVSKILQTRIIRKISVTTTDIFDKCKQSPLNVELPRYALKEVINPFYELYQVLRKYTLELLNKNKWFCEKNAEKNANIYLSVSDIGLLESNLSVTIYEQVKILEKNLFILPTIVTLAPFLGLLGTVWGILLTFSELQTRNITTNSNQMVLGGLSMALATTVMGLVVAIPALIAYNYLKNSIRHYEMEMEHFSHTMLAAIEIQYKKVDIGQ